MSGLARLLAFAVALAVAFGAAAALGRAVGPLERGGEEDAGGHGAMPADGAGAAPPGLALAADGLRVDPVSLPRAPGGRRPLAFRIVDADGEPLRAYDLEHTRRMHLIVVRRDLTGFHHLHPRLGADGTWRAAVTGLEPGAHRAFADFSTGGVKRTLGFDLLVPGPFAPEPLPAPAAVAEAGGGVAVELLPGERRARGETRLAFAVRRDGRDAAVEPYLGARGHLVLLREGDLAYVHTHADEDGLAFETTFPSAGRYRAFLQVSVGGAVRTAAFTVEVAR